MVRLELERYEDDVRITFKHHKTEEVLVLEGILPEVYNPEKSDFFVLLKQDGELEDIPKKSVISLEYLWPWLEGPERFGSV